jgi:hypothetical protein
MKVVGTVALAVTVTTFTPLLLTVLTLKKLVSDGSVDLVVPK